MAMVVGYIPPFCSSTPYLQPPSPKKKLKTKLKKDKNNGVLVFSKNFSKAKYLIKISIESFFSSKSTLMNSSVVNVKRITTNLTGKQFCCGTNSLTTLYRYMVICSKSRKKLNKRKRPLKQSLTTENARQSTDIRRSQKVTMSTLCSGELNDFCISDTWSVPFIAIKP